MWPFGKKKKRQPEEPRLSQARVDPLDSLLEKYGLHQGSGKYYAIGKTITSLKEGEWYVREKIEPLFRQVEIEYKEEIRKARAAYEQQRRESQDRAQAAEAAMDEKREDSKVAEMNRKILELRQQEKELEMLVFQEKMLNILIKEAIEGRQQDEGGANADHELEDALSGETKQLDLESRFIRYRSILHRSGFIRHSGFYPPKMQYVYLFFGICVLLAIGEIGLTMKVVKNLIGYTQVLSIIVAVIYSAAMSVTQAILFKHLIDNFLHRNIGRISLFWLITAIQWLLMAMLFSTYPVPGRPYPIFHIGQMPIIQFGIIPGSFFLLFAFANALVFREAAYLHHLFSRMHGRESVKEWEKRKDVYIAEQQEKFANANREAAECWTALTELEKEEQAGSERIGKLKQECITDLWKGYKDGMQEAAAAREDLMRSVGEPLNIDEL